MHEGLLQLLAFVLHRLCLLLCFCRLLSKFLVLRLQLLLHLLILIAAFWFKFGGDANLTCSAVLILNVKPAIDAHVDDETGHFDFDKADCIARRHVLVPNTKH